MLYQDSMVSSTVSLCYADNLCKIFCSANKVKPEKSITLSGTTEGVIHGKTIEECHEACLAVPIFGGKTFWEAEQDIEWVDE